MTDNTLRRLARLESKQRRAGEGHEQTGRPEQRWVSAGEYNAILRPLMVAVGLPVWPASEDGTEWLASRGLSAEVVVVRIDALRADNPELKGVSRAKIKAAVLGTPATWEAKVAAWHQLNGSGPMWSGTP